MYPMLGMKLWSSPLELAVRSAPGIATVVHPVFYYTFSVDLRTVSSQLVQIPDWGNLLLDTGEGTWGQMARYFGTDPAQPSNVWEALRELKCIFISHAHADHHAGLAKILAMRKQVLRYVLL
jgi:ribonuclease Z